MKELQLKYGCNPNQKPAAIEAPEGKELPFRVLNGSPGYINLLDALNSWQLVKELDQATGLPAAASFKHVSPSGTALGLPMEEKLRKACFVDDIEGLEQSPVAMAYARARGTDRMSSYGDFAALSRTCDKTCATILKREVSDGIIAPDYTPEALEILCSKKKGNYIVLQMDPEYIPEAPEEKQVYGLTFRQNRNDYMPSEKDLANIVTENKDLPEDAKRDMMVALLTLKYTQSNSVCYVKDGQTTGVGAGQQSRIHCTRLAGDKSDLWNLRQWDRVLDLPFRDDIPRAVRDNTIDLYLGEDQDTVLREGAWQELFTQKPEPVTPEDKKQYLSGIRGLCLGSDAFFPFGDNIERGARSGVTYVVQPGGSLRDDQVIETCNAHQMVMAFTGMRLFHH